MLGRFFCISSNSSFSLFFSESDSCFLKHVSEVGLCGSWERIESQWFYATFVETRTSHNCVNSQGGLRSELRDCESAKQRERTSERKRIARFTYSADTTLITSRIRANLNTVIPAACGRHKQEKAQLTKEDNDRWKFAHNTRARITNCLKMAATFETNC